MKGPNNKATPNARTRRLTVPSQSLRAARGLHRPQYRPLIYSLLHSHDETPFSGHISEGLSSTSGVQATMQFAYQFL